MAHQDNLAEELLKEVLSLIQTDIGHIKRLVTLDKLSHYAATDLSRYCKVLQDVQAVREDEEEDEKKKIKGLSNAELAKRVRERLASLEAGMPAKAEESK